LVVLLFIKLLEPINKQVLNLIISSLILSHHISHVSYISSRQIISCTIIVVVVGVLIKHIYLFEVRVSNVSFVFHLIVVSTFFILNSINNKGKENISNLSVVSSFIKLLEPVNKQIISRTIIVVVVGC
jgi:hypothetical protein